MVSRTFDIGYCTVTFDSTAVFFQFDKLSSISRRVLSVSAYEILEVRNGFDLKHILIEDDCILLWPCQLTDIDLYLNNVFRFCSDFGDIQNYLSQ